MYKLQFKYGQANKSIRRCKSGFFGERNYVTSRNNMGVRYGFCLSQGHRYTAGSCDESGGQGDRYTVTIKGQQSHLFFERSPNLTGNNLGRWFVERKTA